MVMNIGQRVTRLEETVERISEALDAFVENANHNAMLSNKNIERIQEGFKILFEELDELKAIDSTDLLKQKEGDEQMKTKAIYL